MNAKKTIMWLFAALVLGLAGLWIVSPVIGSFYDYDILIKGAVVYNGTLTAPKTEDVGIKGDKIVTLGNASGSARETVDAQGLIVTPGFIDVHNHSDMILT